MGKGKEAKTFYNQTKISTFKYLPGESSYAHMYSDVMNCVMRVDFPTPVVPSMTTRYWGVGVGVGTLLWPGVEGIELTLTKGE